MYANEYRYILGLASRVGLIRNSVMKPFLAMPADRVVHLVTPTTTVKKVSATGVYALEVIN